MAVQIDYIHAKDKASLKKMFAFDDIFPNNKGEGDGFILFYNYS